MAAGSKSWLGNLNVRAERYITFAVEQLVHIAGVENHLEFLATREGLDDNSERELYNALSELHACHFCTDILGQTVTDFAVPNVDPVHSPHRQEPNKSCDIKTSLGDSDYFFEVKNSSTQITSRFDYYGTRAYSPATRPYIGQWIIWKLEESFAKGATDLFAVVPFWHRPEYDPDEYFQNGWVEEVLSSYFGVQKTGDNSFTLLGTLEVPAFFHRVYLNP